MSGTGTLWGLEVSFDRQLIFTLLLNNPYPVTPEVTGVNLTLGVFENMVSVRLVLSFIVGRAAFGVWEIELQGRGGRIRE